MKLYPKKLNSIDDLEREKELLIKESRLLEKEEFLSFGESSKKKSKSKKKDKDEEQSEWSVIDLLPISNPIVSMVLKMALRVFTGRGDSKKEAAYANPGQPRFNFKKKAFSIAVEFIGGYLKWKAIELSYKGVKHLIKVHREKKEEEALRKRYSNLG